MEPGGYGGCSNEKPIKVPYGSFFGDFEIPNDEIGQLLFVTVTNSDVVVDLLFAFGRRPILHAHDLHRYKLPLKDLFTPDMMDVHKKSRLYFDEIEGFR